MLLHFLEDGFKEAFVPLINIFHHPFSRLLNCHDIFIKFKIEVLLANYFDDIFNKDKSNLFSNINLSCINGRIELLLSYIKKFEDSITFWEAIPHTVWYECPGGANQITLDSFTFERLRIKRPFLSKIYDESFKYFFKLMLVCKDIDPLCIRIIQLIIQTSIQILFDFFENQQKFVKNYLKKGYVLP